MGKKIRNRVIIILIVTLAGLALILKPHTRADGSKTTWMDFRENIVGRDDSPVNIKLGLDLKGGSHLLMKVDGKEVIKSFTERAAESLRKKLEAKGIPVVDPGVVAGDGQ